MARYDCQVFGAVGYCPDLSYHELHEVEYDLMARLQDMLEIAGAAHIDFWASGDALQFEFALEGYEEDELANLGRRIAEALQETTSGKLVCVDRRLNHVSALYLWPGRCEWDQLPLRAA